ncbi:MAG: hypothetical protein LRY71_01855 [Bacillaceae bacterium]|nr:hypothetical protein [Bacillaceae bacterium]
MKYFTFVLLLFSIIMMGCSDSANKEPVDNDIIVNDEDIVIENNDNVTDENKENEQEEEEANNDTEVVVADEEEETTQEKSNTLLTSDEAIIKIKEHLNIIHDDEVNIVVDREEDGKFIIQVFDVMVGEDGIGHTSTRGWYSVDRSTGKVELLF